MNRAWRDYAKANGGDMAAALRSDAVFRNATRFALKLGEHTWGKDVKKNLFDNYSWRNDAFRRAKSPGSPNASQYATLEASWWEQRDWGVTIAVDTLLAAKHPLGTTLLEAFAELAVDPPDVSGMIKGAAGAVYECSTRGISLAFDASGAISHLSRNGVVSSTSWTSLFTYEYRSYSASDVASFFSQYCKSNASWVAHDYGKPGLPNDVEGKAWHTALDEIWVSPDSCRFAIRSSFPKELHLS